MMKKKMVFWVIYITVLILALEAMLRVTGICKTYTEKCGQGYASYYNQVLTSWYHCWEPHKPITYNSPEIRCEYMANSLGVREKEIPPVKSDSTNRLFFLGDSFTEGDGVEYPYSMPRYFEKKLDSACLNWEVYNMGVSGSDPVYEFMQLRDQVMPLKPTHIILSINGSDITDVMVRGGFERFHADGTTHYKRAPLIAYLYQYCHLFRLMQSALMPWDYKQTFFTHSQYNFQSKNAKAVIVKAILEMQILCEQNKVKFLVIMHPSPGDLAFIHQHDEILDIATDTSLRRVAIINSFPDFAQVINANNYLKYSLKNNGHFNRYGYCLYAGIIFNEIDKRYPDFWN